jgi:putative flippase GtrA
LEKSKYSKEIKLLKKSVAPLLFGEGLGVRFNQKTLFLPDRCIVARMLSPELIKKIIRFGLVGASGMVLDYSVTFLCKEFFLLDKYVANFFGFGVAATSNYFLNRSWVFSEHARSHRKQYTGFIGIALAGLALNSFIIWLFTDKIFTLNFYIAKGVAIGVVFIWNFTLNYLFNFKKKEIIS